MGLDIVVWTNVRISNAASSSDKGFQAFTLKGWEDRLKPLVNKAFYTGEIAMNFRAGSYSGYGRVRAWLCSLANEMPIERFWKLGEAKCIELPLGELLNFADNEGVIGTEACKRLAKQFDDIAPRLETVDDEDITWLRPRFEEWQKAFHLAADNNGAVMFC